LPYLRQQFSGLLWHIIINLYIIGIHLLLFWSRRTWLC
jgi:hypothetical protein